MKSNLRPGIKVIELDCHINDPDFSKTVLKLFDEMEKKGLPGKKVLDAALRIRKESGK